jgi:hypothetical protein
VNADLTMRLTKTLCLAILTSSLVLTLNHPARADDDTPANLSASPVTSPANVAEPYTPMTQSDRVHHWVKSTFSFEAAIRAAVGAAILQGTNTPSEWGQGAEGYARRFGNDVGQHVIRQTLLFGAGDLLDEDNRFFASGLSGTGPRVRYAIESTFLARRHDGHRRLSYSRLGSVVATAFISREWQPRSTDHVHNALVGTGTVLGTEIGFNIAREFLPKVFHTQRLDSR